MTRRRVNQRYIHRLEYELGFRDDPPPSVIDAADLVFGPGIIIPIECDPADIVRLDDGRYLVAEGV